MDSESKIGLESQDESKMGGDAERTVLSPEVDETKMEHSESEAKLAESNADNSSQPAHGNSSVDVDSVAQGTHLPEDFVYNPEMVKPELGEYEIPKNVGALYGLFGFDFWKRSNIHEIEPDVIMTVCGNAIHFLNLQNHETKIQVGITKGSIGAVALHPSRRVYAVGTKGKNPTIHIYEYPSLALKRILRNGTENGYNCMEFNRDGTKLASVGSFPDFMLTVWDWKNESAILRSKAFSQEVYKVSFCHDIEGQLTTSGTGHIRFWKMAETFTGLKLQGDLGKFGKVELSDISGYAELSDGKVLSGTETGELLLWEGNLVKCKFVRPEGKQCHDGCIEAIHLCRDERMFVSAGSDGFLKWWDYDTIDAAELGEGESNIEIEPKKQVLIGEGVHAYGLVRGMKEWIIQDKNGRIFTYNDESEEIACKWTSHSGPIAGIDASPVDNVAATLGEDGVLKCWDYINKTCMYESRFHCGGSSLVWVPRDVDFSGRSVAAGFKDGVVRMLYRGSKNWMLLHVFKPHNSPVVSLKYSPNSLFLATVDIEGHLFLFSIIASSSTDGKDYKPAGYVTLSAPVISLDWTAMSNSIIVVLVDGQILEVDVQFIASGDESSYSRELSCRKFTFNRLIHPVQPEPEGDDDSNEEKEDEHKEVEDTIPLGKPLALVCNSDVKESFLLSTDGFDGQYVYKCSFDTPSQQSVSFISNSDGITFMKYSSSRRFLLVATSNGSWRCYNTESLGPYFEVNLHDTVYGKIRNVAMSFDERFILSAGNDGQIFVTRVDVDKLQVLSTRIQESIQRHVKFVPEDEAGISAYTLVDMAQCDPGVFEVIHSSLRADSEEREALIQTVEDITSTEHYSIEDEKQKMEEDRRIKNAAVKKEAVRERIRELQLEHSEAWKQNLTLPEDQRLHREDFAVDASLIKELEAKGEVACDEVRKEMEWFEKKAEIARNKIEDKYLRCLETERICIHAFRSTDYVHSIRVKKLDDDITNALAKYDSEEQSDSNKTEEEGNMAKSQMGACDSSQYDRAQSADTVTNFNDRMNLRQQRLDHLKEMEDKRPRPDYDQPCILDKIEYTKSHVGNYLLRSEEGYPVADVNSLNASSKKREVMQLTRKIVKASMSFNDDVMGLRNRKKEITEKLRKINDRLKVIHEELGVESGELESYELDESEYPERRCDVTDEDIAKLIASQRTQKSSSSPTKDSSPQEPVDETKLNDQTFELVPSPSETVGSTVSHIPVITFPSDPYKLKSIPSFLLRSIPSLRGAVNLTNDDPSVLEVSMMNEHKRSLEIEKKEIEKEKEVMIVEFDEDVGKMMKRRMELQSNISISQIRLLILQREANCLRSFVADDEKIMNKMRNEENEVKDVQSKIEQINEAISLQRKHLAKVQDDLAQVRDSFDHTFEAFYKQNPTGDTANEDQDDLKQTLMTIFMKDANKSGDKTDEEGIGTTDFYSAFLEDTGDADAENEEEEEKIPEGCPSKLFSEICASRSNRMNIEKEEHSIKEEIEKMENQLKGRKQRLISLQSKLQETKNEQVGIQKKKMAQLNQLDGVVFVKISDIHVDGSDDVLQDGGDVEMMNTRALPLRLDNCLIFTQQNLTELKNRAHQLDDQIDQLVEELGKMELEHRELQKKLQKEQKLIETNKKECMDLQMLKFGQEINLDDLVKMSASGQLDELEEKIRMEEMKCMNELSKCEKEVKEAEVEILKATEQNTKQLEDVAKLTSEQFELEHVLNSTNADGLHAVDQGPSIRKDAEERQRLIELVQLQAKQIDSVKAEINMLRRKGNF